VPFLVYEWDMPRSVLQRLYAPIGLAFSLGYSQLAGAQAAAPAGSSLPPLPAPSATLPPASPPPPAPSASPPPPADDGARWKGAYAEARERLLAGDFAEAAGRFEALVQSAPSPEDRSLAESLRDLARTWAARGVTLGPRPAAAEVTEPRTGKRTIDELAQLYGASILYGVGTGFWLDIHTNPNPPGTGVLPMVLFSGLAAGTVVLLDVGHPLPYGVPQSIVSGMNVGFESGLVLSLWNLSQHDSNSHWSGTTVADVIWAFSSIGAVGGGALGAALGTTPGRASFVGSAALWTGVFAGFLAAATSSDQDRASNALLAAELGVGGGAIAGLVTAGAVSPSIARVRFLDIGAIGGGLLLGGLYVGVAGRNPDPHAGWLSAALGVGGGLGIAWVATAGMAPDRPEERPAPPVAVEPTLTGVRGGATLGVTVTM
jgi:hypothetical protein